MASATPPPAGALGMGDTLVDVAIVGGGPAGSTVAALLRKHSPGLSVLVIEREVFPREHIGESQLPAISGILHEMGVWDKVEAAGFPIKIGASLTWGRDSESWDFDFVNVEEFVDEPRPARFQGQRTKTAFQVDRAIYDQILLDHAASLGASVRQGVRVAEVLVDAAADSERAGARSQRLGTTTACQFPSIAGLVLDDGSTVRARWYVDGSGNVGLFRRALCIEVDAPKVLRNVAFWDYWTNADWAVRIGVGATRIQVRSLAWGWTWFIPMGPTRTSVGLVCPAEYYQRSGLTPEELYSRAMREQPQLAQLLKNAASEGNVRATKDWSFVADRVSGPNWLLVGEAAGFADPILSAGMTLAHTSGKEAACTILQCDLEHSPAPTRPQGHAQARGSSKHWPLDWYDEKTRRNIRQHIRFAEFWYASNKCFGDLQEHCREIARSSGLRLSPQEAWAWLAQGGFSNQDSQGTKLGSFDIGSALHLAGRFAGAELDYQITRYSQLKLDLLGAQEDWSVEVVPGGLRRVPCLRRGVSILPRAGIHENLVRALQQTSDAAELFHLLRRSIDAQFPAEHRGQVLRDHMFALETMLTAGWVKGKLDPRKGKIRVTDPGSVSIRPTSQGLEALQRRDDRAAEVQHGAAGRSPASTGG